MKAEVALLNCKRQGTGVKRQGTGVCLQERFPFLQTYPRPLSFTLKSHEMC